MDQLLDHKEFRVFTNYPKILQQTIDWYNGVFDTDFKFERFVRDAANYTYVSYTTATDFDIFQLAYNYGKTIEAYDKSFTTNLPPGYFDDKLGRPSDE
jgi:hypothetical protein